MFKKLILTSFLISILIGVIYPHKKESTKLFDYCFSLENILSRNSMRKTKSVNGKIISISKDIAKFGVRKTKGALINKMIDQYKTSKKLFIITFVPNQLYCFLGYWIEKVKPGTLTSIFYEKSKQRINEYKDTKKEVDQLIKDINSEYKSIKKEIKNLF